MINSKQKMMIMSDRTIHPEQNVNFVKKSLIDCFVLCALLVISLCVAIYMKPLKRGFFCGDMSIRHPYLSETVSITSLYLISLGFPIIFLGMGEILFANEEDYEGDVKHHVFKWQVPKGFVRTYDITVSFLFGYVVCALIVLLTRNNLGVMRPNFIAACQPSIRCKNGTDLFIYIEDFSCRDVEVEAYARMSFPNKHATLCFYTMVYLSVYLQNKVRWEYLSVFNNLMQVTFMVVAWLVSVSQVTDYYSHMSDILGGIIIGSLVAWFNVAAVYNFFLSGVRMQPVNENEKV